MEDHCEPMETVVDRNPVSKVGSVLSSPSQQQFTDHDLSNLHASLRIIGKNSNQIRYEAIHLRTSNELTVKDVIDYFSEYNPDYVEKVDEQSFNVVWRDSSTTARALFSMSQKVAGIPIQATPSNMIDNMKIPSGCWLLGKEHINLSSVLLRFSMRGDRRPCTKEICSQYSRNGTRTTTSLPINKSNPWGNLSQCWDESYELSERNQRHGGDHGGRAQLKARRRIQK